MHLWIENNENFWKCVFRYDNFACKLRLNIHLRSRVIFYLVSLRGLFCTRNSTAINAAISIFLFWVRIVPIARFRILAHGGLTGQQGCFLIPPVVNQNVFAMHSFRIGGGVKRLITWPFHWILIFLVIRGTTVNLLALTYDLLKNGIGLDKKYKSFRIAHHHFFWQNLSTAFVDSFHFSFGHLPELAIIGGIWVSKTHLVLIWYKNAQWPKFFKMYKNTLDKKWSQITGT